MPAQGRRAQVREQMRRQVERQGQVRGEEMRSEVRAQMRTQELMPRSGRRPQLSQDILSKAAGLRLLETYADLAQRGEHLFSGLLAGETPTQWSHYPEDDAIDHGSGFQWFYHSHSPEDRPGSTEHGHIHLFARRKLWSRRLRSAREKEFSKLSDEPLALAATRHLLGIGFDAKGVPINLFTVNSWVTGDLMLSAPTTIAMLDRIALDTGHKEVDAVVECIVKLFRAEIQDLLKTRDERLMGREKPGILLDESLELLSELSIQLDSKLNDLAV